MTKPTITMTPAASSNVKAHGYDAASKTLRIAFHSGAVYDYHAVPPEVATGLGKAKSIGGFMASTVRNKFKAELIQAKPVPQ